MLDLLFLLWVAGDPNTPVEVTLTPVQVTLMEPTETELDEPITVRNGELHDCTVKIVMDSGHVFYKVLPASDPAGGSLHAVDLSEYEGRIVVNASCRRRMGNDVSEPGGVSNAIIRSLPVTPPKPPVLLDR
jgi:hypothetical protein